MKCAIMIIDDRGKFSGEPANPIKKLSPFFIDLRRTLIEEATTSLVGFRFSLRKETP